MDEASERLEVPQNNTESDSDSNIGSSTAAIEEKLSSMPEILEYVQGLRKLILRHEKKIKKLQRRLKRREMKDVAIQVEEGTPKDLTEEITEAAQSAMVKAGFAYEETSGLYYDYNSGYYYNAEYGLYYDGNTGTYMSYDNDKQEYVFHSLAQTQENGGLDHNKRSKSQRKAQERKKIKKLDSQPATDLEEGECSDWSELKEDTTDTSSDSDIDISKQWPPCMRVIVEETTIPTVKAGSLHIITYDGGTLGREGKHDILLPDINVSKHHLQFKFDKDRDRYLVTDLGSRNGTLLNGKRMSSSKQESEAMEVPHGSKLQIGGTVLLCHVHPGSQTCGLCEPGLIQKSNEIKVNAGGSKQSLHKQELRNLKKKFAVGQMSRKSSSLGAGYTDRAQVRRDTVGSQNENEKTQVASLEQSISSDNKGFKLLAKMGWSEGQPLGKDGTGRTEPVELISNPGTAGIGISEVAVPVVSKAEKSDIWSKARERYQQLSEKDTTDE